MLETDASRPNRNASYRCSLCNKSFVAESTQKRHGYYCRNKLRKPNIPRKKSCVGCIRAKTRCTWPLAGPTCCVRCSERGLECEHDGVQQMSSDSSAEDMPIDFLNLVTDNELASSTSALQPAEWAVEPNLLRSLDLSGQFRDYGSFTPVDPFNTSSVMPGTQLVNSGPFSLRITTGSGQILVPLLLRILQSYPFMLLRKETFPPFMNPLLYSWAESGKTPSQQTLINCVSIVHMFKAQREANKSFMWTVIKLEQERIAAGHVTFDRWELLAALQALLIYCLLRLSDETGYRELDMPLLATINVVARALAMSLGGNHMATFASVARLAWHDWIFNESLRRTVLILRILNMAVDISAALPCRPMSGFAIVPLASNATLWGAQTIEQWQAEFSVCYEERTIYGLSETGQLMKLQQDSTGIQSSMAKWEDWSAAVGELGSLVTIAGTLLENSFPNVP